MVNDGKAITKCPELSHVIGTGTDITGEAIDPVSIMVMETPTCAYNTRVSLATSIDIEFVATRRGCSPMNIDADAGRFGSGLLKSSEDVFFVVMEVRLEFGDGRAP